MSSSIPNPVRASTRKQRSFHPSYKSDDANNAKGTNPLLDNPVTSNQSSNRKRKRLNAVLDKISNHLNTKNQNGSLVNERGNNNNCNGNGNGSSEDNLMADLSGDMTNEEQTSAALRRERWRDNQQQSVEEHYFAINRGGTYPLLVKSSGPGGGSLGEVFKFDSFDRERYLSGGSGSGKCREEPQYGSQLQPQSAAGSEDNQDPEIISPISGRSPHSSLSSPQVSVDSPRICFSPLRIKDSIEEEEDAGLVLHTLPKLSVRGCESEDGYARASSAHYSRLTSSTGGSTVNQWLEPGAHQVKLLPGYVATSLSRPISPNPAVTPSTPSPTPLHALRHMPIHLTEAYRRRCLSDTDLSSSWDDQARNRHLRNISERTKELIQTSRCATATTTASASVTGRYLLLPGKGGSLESEASSCTSTSITAQESPLDLSVRSSLSSSAGINSTGMAGSMDNIQQPSRGRGRSHGSRARAKSRGTASMERYSLDRLDVSPVVETVSGGHTDVGFVCPICGQMFSLSDRLAKHMASRHKSRSTDSGTKAYTCDVCKRSFARSDMLTRHMRLHTGVKPYTCRVCGQVFSRSDHLSTHQRTHTGEKPYRCPSCPYSACRRDMITRHMRTHARYELQDSTGGSLEADSHPSSLKSSVDSPFSAGSGLVASRSISCESTELAPLATSSAAPSISIEELPSPMDTAEETKKE